MPDRIKSDFAVCNMSFTSLLHNLKVGKPTPMVHTLGNVTTPEIYIVISETYYIQLHQKSLDTQ